MSMKSETRLRRLEHLALWWENPWRAGLAALLVYALCALRWNASWQASATAYFNYLADAFLHGQFSLRMLPPVTSDLILFGGKWFLYWPPFPAILLLPFVAMFGVNFSDTLFTLCVGALNVVFIGAIFRAAQQRGVIDLSPTQRGWLVIFFALGTVHLTLAPFGRVWYTGQVVAFECVCLAYLAALRLTGSRAFLAVGLSTAAALLTRNHLVFAGLWPIVYLGMSHRRMDWQRLIANVVLSGIPIIAALGLLGLYDYLRFGNIFDNGVSYHQMDPLFVDNFRRYGLFNLYYLPANLFYQFVAYPLPYNNLTFMGGGLFWLSPVFIAAAWGIVKGRPRWSVCVLLATIGLVAIPIWMLMGTGWAQFGPRYTLDFTVPLLLLTAMGVRYWPLKALVLLTLLSLVEYFVGMMYWGALMLSN